MGHKARRSGAKALQSRVKGMSTYVGTVSHLLETKEGMNWQLLDIEAC